MKKILALLIVVLSHSIYAYAEKDKETTPLTETHWVLTNLNTKVISKNEEGMESFIIFSNDKSFSGFAGCNKYQGVYSSEKGKISCGKIGITRMACEDSNNEEEFIKFLNKVKSYKITDKQLVLKGKGKKIAIFEAK